MQKGNMQYVDFNNLHTTVPVINEEDELEVGESNRHCLLLLCSIIACLCHMTHALNVCLRHRSLAQVHHAAGT